jgi:hypothetical protein
MIKATCCVFPDGSVMWVESDHKKIADAIADWKRRAFITDGLSKPKYTMGCVEISMSEQVFNKVRAKI